MRSARAHRWMRHICSCAQQGVGTVVNVTNNSFQPLYMSVHFSASPCPCATAYCTRFLYTAVNDAPLRIMCTSLIMLASGQCGWCSIGSQYLLSLKLQLPPLRHGWWGSYSYFQQRLKTAQHNRQLVIALVCIAARCAILFSAFISLNCDGSALTDSQASQCMWNKLSY